MKLTLDKAEEILKKHTTEEHWRAIISHGYGICTEEAQPETDLERRLFAVDELTVKGMRTEAEALGLGAKG